jgi:hypothetical protein
MMEIYQVWGRVQATRSVSRWDDVDTQPICDLFTKLLQSGAAEGEVLVDVSGHGHIRSFELRFPLEASSISEAKERGYDLLQEVHPKVREQYPALMRASVMRVRFGEMVAYPRITEEVPRDKGTGPALAEL